ncbi:MAG TPA: MopE-related protein [Chitinophagales bacterium]|nr:MopE-related protein [Chitinophagales bacterium]
MHKLLPILLPILSLLVMTSTNAQVYEYTNDPIGFPSYHNPNFYAERLLRSNEAAGAGDACDIGFSTKHFSTEAVFEDNIAGVVLKLIPDSLVTLNISSISAAFRITEKGPIYARYSYSLDSGVTWVNQGSDITPIINDCGGSTINGTWDMDDFSSTELILIKISGYNALDSVGRLNITTMNIYGTVDIIDEDGDGYGIYIDCDDTNPLINPGATELCNDIDEDCDGISDELSSTITPTGIINICKHDFVELYAPSGYTSYQWLKNGYIVPGATDSILSTEKPGYYQVVIEDGVCTDTSLVQAVAVKENPFANIYSPDGIDLCLDDTLKIKASYGATYTWQWYKDGIAIPFENFYKMQVVETGAYYCNIVTFYGCSRVTDTLNIVKTCRLSEETNSNFQIYPNPVVNNLNVNITVKSTEETDASLQIINLEGQVVNNYFYPMNNGILHVNLPVTHLQPGVYIIKAYINKEIISKIFVVS